MSAQSVVTSSVTQYFSKFEDRVRRVEAALATLLAQPRVSPLERQAIVDVIQVHSKCELNRSKRLRGVLFMILHDAGSCSTEECELSAASAELVHAASLVYDDIQDRHVTRWGSSSAWTTMGPALAINLAMRMVLLGLREPAIDGMTTTIISMLGGQDRDIALNSRAEYSVREYVRAVRGKTCALFEWVALRGAHSLGHEVAHIARNYARDFGMAYQILDDLDEIQDDASLSQVGGATILRALGNQAGSSNVVRASCALARKYCERANAFALLLKERGVETSDDLIHLNSVLVADRIRRILAARKP